MSRVVKLAIGVCCLLLATIGGINAQPDCALPLVAKKSVALGIFNSIAQGLETPAKRRRYVIRVSDEGGSWSIYEKLRSGDYYRTFRNAKGEEMESLQVTAGGGRLGMSIDKCSAAISDAAFQR
jgi:hypothetical protein